MGIVLHSYLPTAGEVSSLADHPAAAKHSTPGLAQRTIGDSATSRKATLDYMTQICLAAEHAGIHSILVPISGACEDPLVSSAALIARTTTLKFLCAFRPGLLTPVLFAQMVASFQRLSGNRMALNVTPGVPGHVSNRYGDWHDKQERLDQAGEFLTIMKGSWGDEPFDFEGTYHRVKNASVARPDELPRIFYGGSSEMSMRFAAKHADVYLSYVEPPDMLKERLERVRNMAADEGRELSIALSFGITARSTNAEAWEAVRGQMRGVDMSPEALERSAEAIAAQGYASSGARQRLLGALKGNYANAEISPNLWIGPMLVRGGSGPGLVGSYDEVVDRMEELHALGVGELLSWASGPALEGHYEFAENIVPRLRARGLLEGSPAVATPA